VNDFQTLPEAEHQDSRTFEFCQDSLRKVSWLYIGWLVSTGLMASLAYYVYRGSPMRSIPSALIIYYLITLVHVAYRFKTGGKANVLSPDILFLLFYTMYHLGYVTLYALGIVPYSSDVFVFENSIPKALFIVNLGVVSFILGYEIIGSRSSAPRAMGPIKIPDASWCTFGLIFIIIGVAAHLVVAAYLSLTGLIASYGYNAFQDIDIHTGSFFWTNMHRAGFQLMLFGLVIYIVSSALRYGKLFNSKLALVLAIVHLVFVSIEGDRGPFLMLGAPILLVRHYLVKRIRIRNLVWITAMVLFLYTMVGPLVRGFVTMKPVKMVQELKYKRQIGEANWTSPFVEMGSSFLVVNITSHEVPDAEAYWKGASWRAAVFHIVPFFEGFALRRGWTRWAPSVWITHTYYGSLRAGRAFTVAAEGYLNFGYAGVIIELMFFGLVIRWITTKFGRNPSAIWAIIMVGFFGVSLMVIRNHIELILYAWARLAVLVALINLFLPSTTVSETNETTLLDYGYEAAS